LRTDLRRFPRHTLRGDRPLYRIHRYDKHPWWFSSNGKQRFDPVGTGQGACYLGYTALAAFIEVFRIGMLIAEDDLNKRLLHTVTLGRDLKLADLTSRRALEFEVTASLGANPLYDESQEFARRAIAAGFDGVRYWARHDLAQKLQSVALFAAAGQPNPTDPHWPLGTDEPIPDDLLADAKRLFRYRTLPIP
jgi:hypothetical protein